jgi:hypothetical protein
MARAPDLSASLVSKGNASPISPGEAVSPPPGTGHEAPEIQEPARAPAPTPTPAARPRARQQASEPAPRVLIIEPAAPVEARIAVTTRLPASMLERLRVLTFQRRRTKQDIIEDALSEYLDRYLPPD